MYIKLLLKELRLLFNPSTVVTMGSVWKGASFAFLSALTAVSAIRNGDRVPPAPAPSIEPVALISWARVFTQFTRLWKGKEVQPDSIVDFDGDAVGYDIARLFGSLRAVVDVCLDRGPSLFAQSTAFVLSCMAFYVLYDHFSSQTQVELGNAASRRRMKRSVVHRSIISHYLGYFLPHRRQERVLLAAVLAREACRDADIRHWRNITDNERRLSALEAMSPDNRRLLDGMLTGNKIDWETDAPTLVLSLERVILQRSTEYAELGFLAGTNSDNLEMQAVRLQCGKTILDYQDFLTDMRQSVREAAPERLELSGNEGRVRVSAALYAVGGSFCRKAGSSISTLAKFLGTSSEYLRILRASE